MRKRFQRVNCILRFVGHLLQMLGLVLLLPLIPAALYWGTNGEGWRTVAAFVIPAGISVLLGLVLRAVFRSETLDTTGSMLMCALSWLFASALGALPLVIGIRSGYLNAYFEAMSGFTTTGITVYCRLDDMPRSILFWRALTQWLGGIGILSFFLIIVFRGSGSHHIFGAESHKISAGRPAPGLFSTLRILWGIYVGFTLLAVAILALERMPGFDAVCHALTALSTGGFSPHDSSIEYYRLTGHQNYRIIEYTLTFLMMLGGINFLIHYRVLTRDFKALWDNIEIRYWWRLVAGFTVIVMIDCLVKTGALEAVFTRGPAIDLGEAERVFRHSVFQVVSVLTTTGFTTKDISSDFFGTTSRHLFLVMMVIGGCVGSTGGGFKVLRVAILNRLVLRELFKVRVSDRASTALVIDNKVVPESEIHRVAALFFSWIVLLAVGGGITALLSSHGPFESLSGMFSALGNIGPCYISVQDMIDLHPVVKLTYIFGMLAGRLEILPVLLLFSRKVWR
ncbi:MAG: TrkH family potassium uptake protein [Phycisphaerales bacterium]|nr:MAG: TrkH family potassium uptake protein [Phycisphaerales bacterium]